MSSKVKCTCGWSWNKSDSSKKDMYICHECGRDNSNNMKNGGWLDSYADGGTMQEHQENYNDSQASAPEGMIGDGFSNVGRNYSPAWGGSFQEGGEIPNAQNGKKKPVYKKNKVQKIEKRIDNFLGKPQQRAMSMADISPNEDPVDNIRHSFAGRYTQDAIAKKLGNGPIANIAGIAGSNLMGAAHELSTIIKDDRSWLTKLRESGEDMVNNAVGSVIGAIPFMDEKAKDKMMYKMSYGNLLPDGYVSTEKSKKKRQSDNMYFKNKKGKVDREYQMGGNIYPVNYIPQAQGGMSMPGSVGFTYARTQGIPSKGPRRNQVDVTDASAQNGQEMQYYREGLDWKPKTISRKGSVIKDDRGQWAHPGEITEINSPYITMQGVPYPVLGISDTGDMQMMYPEEEYEFDGEKVTEYPMAKNGKRQEQKSLQNLNNLVNFTNYNTKQPGGWLDSL